MIAPSRGQVQNLGLEENSGGVGFMGIKSSRQIIAANLDGITTPSFGGDNTFEPLLLLSE